jgi:superfamily II DNA/RNA helicase
MSSHFGFCKNLSVVLIVASFARTYCAQLQTGAGLDESNIAQCHSDLTQAERIAVVNQCKNGEKNFLVSTDILAKGIDIDRCNVVVNYDLPVRFDQTKGQNHPDSKPDFEKHLHRVGRAGRANKKGVAFHLVNEQEHWWHNHLDATMAHWANKPLTWLWLDDPDEEWNKVDDELNEENPNRIATV